MPESIDVTIVGGGMITNDLLLPSIYHLQRTAVVGKISICALNTPPLKALKDNAEIREAFPGQDFQAHPALSAPEEENFPELYKGVIASMDKRQAVVVAMPDPLHHQVVMQALASDQHVLCVKPLVLAYDQAEQIREEAFDRGLFVGVEYHKRFDRRSLLARRHYRLGHFGELRMGEAKMIEPYLYRHSNFQNWFICENTDPFVYVGCHYVDLVYFITGLKPTEVSVVGVKGTFPNGKQGYMWANGRVRFENGAVLSVTDGLGYPDEGAGSNEQCLEMFCEGKSKSALIKHDDQFRGVTHGYLEGRGPGGTGFNFVNPDFFHLVPWHAAGYMPAGYGYDSVAAILGTIQRIEAQAAGLREGQSLKRRQQLIREADEKGLIATPANSSINELVVEAARRSILADGKAVKILYGEHPHVQVS
jgi:D-galacturonate reductase